MKKIICYGDSNTYGFDARLFSGTDRLPEHIRWTGILSRSGEYRVVSAGKNGREIPHDRCEKEGFHMLLQLQAPFDLVTVMLGSNDLGMMSGCGMPEITARMEAFLADALQDPELCGQPEKLLLIAPTKTQMSFLGPEEEKIDRISEEFAEAYRELAERFGVHFADAGSWDIDLCIDGLHFSPEGHAVFAEKIGNLLHQIL